MFIIKLALRNLTRHKKRTLVTAIIIAMAVFIYILADSLMLGIEEISYNNIIDLETGHLQIMTEDFHEEKEEFPLEHLLQPDQELYQTLRERPGVQALTPELRFSAELNNGIDQLPVVGVGVDPKQMNRVFTTSNYLIEGSWLEPGGNRAVMGKGLAELMELGVGDYLTLLVQDRDGTFNTLDLELGGLISSPNPEVNENLVFVPLNRAQQVLGVEERISQLALRLEDRQLTASTAEELNSIFSKNHPELVAYTWRDAAEFIVSMAKSQRIENYIILGIILIIAAVGIINTVILSALERLEEIGMMKALGLKEWELVLDFMIEAVAIGVIGGLIGCTLGAGGVSLLNYYGLDMAAFGGGETNYGIPIMDKIYGAWNFRSFVFVFLFGIIVSLVASIFPAIWAARKDPVKAIYHR